MDLLKRVLLYLQLVEKNKPNIYSIPTFKMISWCHSQLDYNPLLARKSVKQSYNPSQWVLTLLKEFTQMTNDSIRMDFLTTYLR